MVEHTSNRDEQRERRGTPRREGTRMERSRRVERSDQPGRGGSDAQRRRSADGGRRQTWQSSEPRGAEEARWWHESLSRALGKEDAIGYIAAMDAIEPSTDSEAAARSIGLLEAADDRT